jgi:hypothetical protein
MKKKMGKKHVILFFKLPCWLILSGFHPFGQKNLCEYATNSCYNQMNEKPLQSPS